MLNESCDLGMGNELDGCTDTCEVENGFTCSTNSTTTKSICSYEGAIELKLVSTSK